MVNMPTKGILNENYYFGLTPLDSDSFYGGKNHLNKYLRTKFGKRFFVISDQMASFIGLFDRRSPQNSIMSNSYAEKKSNLEVINEARGDVLIAGLGIGLIVLPIMNKPEVKSVDIVELRKEIIDLIVPQLPLNDKVKIINANAFSFQTDKKYDIIYSDTNADEDTVNLGAVAKEYFKQYLKKEGKVLVFNWVK